MMQRKKLLFVCEAVTLAHISRLFKLADFLSKRNYEIYFAFNGNFEELFEFGKLKKIKIYSQSKEEFNKKLYFNLPLFNKKLLEKYIQEEIKIIKSVKPDLVIGDFRPSLKFSTKFTNIPLVVISNFYWSSKYSSNMPASKTIIRDILGGKIARVLINGLFGKIYMHFYLKGYNDLAKKYGLKKAENIFEAYHKSDNLVYSDISEIYPIEDIESIKNLFIGPIIWEPRIKENYNLSHKEKLIYISLGSSGTINKKIIDKIIDKNEKVFFVTGGKELDFVENKNLIVRKYAQASKILPYAKAAVLNGGSPSVYQSLYYGIPVVLSPDNIDQYLFSQIISKKYGLMIEEFDKLDEKKEVIKKNVEDISKIIKSYNPEEKFFKHIKDVLHKQSLNNNSSN